MIPTAHDHDLEHTVRTSGLPLVVEFFADWCAPCRALAPVLETMAAEYAGKVRFLKLDTDRSPAMAVRYAIRGIPTLMVFVEGREYGRLVGAVARARLDALLARALAGEPPREL